MKHYCEMDHFSTGRVAAVPGRNAALDLLRFMAAGLIVLYHFQDEGPWPLDQFSPVFLRGYLATDFFLILSGYVLSGAYGDRIDCGEMSDERFLLRRALRIWPAHLAVLAAFVVVQLLAAGAGVMPSHDGQYDWRSLPAQIALIQAWGLGTGGGWNVPTWSLSALLVCYAAFPTLWRALGGVRSGMLLFGGGLAAVAGADLLTRRFFGQAVYDLHFDVGVFRALPLFAFGVCIARADAGAAPGRAGSAWPAVAAAAAVTALQLVGRFDLLSVALLGLMISFAGRARLTADSGLAGKAASVSFSLYITHILVGMVWFHGVRALVAAVQPALWAQWTLWALALPLALLSAVLFERLVDRPLQAWVAAALKRSGLSAGRAPARFRAATEAGPPPPS